MHSPTVSDFQCLKRILRYVKGTVSMGLTLYTDIDSTLRAYCDTDWADCHETRRSIAGFCTFLGCNLISWSAQKQDSVARSSTEAEYRTLSDTASEISWITAVLAEMGLKHVRPAEAYCDNLSAVHLTANPVMHKRTKHFETHYHYARERVAKGLLVVKNIPATQQLPTSSQSPCQTRASVTYGSNSVWTFPPRVCEGILIVLGLRPKTK